MHTLLEIVMRQVPPGPPSPHKPHAQFSAPHYIIDNVRDKMQYIKRFFDAFYLPVYTLMMADSPEELPESPAQYYFSSQTSQPQAYSTPSHEYHSNTYSHYSQHPQHSYPHLHPAGPQNNMSYSTQPPVSWNANQYQYMAGPSTPSPVSRSRQRHPLQNSELQFINVSPGSAARGQPPASRKRVRPGDNQQSASNKRRRQNENIAPSAYGPMVDPHPLARTTVFGVGPAETNIEMPVRSHPAFTNFGSVTARPRKSTAIASDVWFCIMPCDSIKKPAVRPPVDPDKLTRERPKDADFIACRFCS